MIESGSDLVDTEYRWASFLRLVGLATKASYFGFGGIGGG
jgi:hypothetical protein